MQSLIKPALFWVARLELFLSVVAWASSRWGHQVDIQASAHSVRCSNSKAEFAIFAFSRAYPTWCSGITSIPSGSESHPVFNPRV